MTDTTVFDIMIRHDILKTKRKDSLFMEHKKNHKGSFSSTFGFLMASVGSAVGLGNLWSFPYKMGKNGGFAFLAIYILLTFFVGMVLMLAEFGIGRKSGKGVIQAYETINRKYKIVGIFGWLAPLLILGFYSMLGGYCLKYTFANIGDIFGASFGVGGADTAEYFGALSQDQLQTTVYTLLFILLTMIIVGAGVQSGIERFSVIAMPALFIMLAITIVRAVTLPGAAEGLAFVFKPNLEPFKGTGWISVLAAAGGQMFFSISVGMGINITYGSYMKKTDDLQKNAIIIPFADTFVAIMAAMATMPAVFAAGLDPGQGAGMLFVTLQSVFSAMGTFGPIFGTLFFALVFIAALTSSIALAETTVSAMIDTTHKTSHPMGRKILTVLIGIFVSVEGLLVSLDGLGSHGFPKIFGQETLLDSFDLVSEGILLPLGSLLLAIIVGWTHRGYIDDEVEQYGFKFTTKKIWYFCIRWIVPPAMVFILAGQLSTFFGLGWF